MPTYEYKCDACGKQFDQFQSITAPALTKCPHCHKNKLRRLIGAGAGLIFKGSGFYITDYRSDSYKAGAKSSGSSGSGAASAPKTPSTNNTASPSSPSTSSAPASTSGTSKAKAAK